MGGVNLNGCCCLGVPIAQPCYSFDDCDDKWHFVVFELSAMTGCDDADFGDGDQFACDWVSTDSTWRTFERLMTGGRTVSVQVKTSVELDAFNCAKYLQIRINDGTYGIAFDTVDGLLARVDYPGYESCGAVTAVYGYGFTCYRRFLLGDEPASLTITFAGAADGFGTGCSAFNTTETLYFVSVQTAIDGYSYGSLYQTSGGVGYSQHQLGGSLTRNERYTTCFQSPSFIEWFLDCSITTRADVNDSAWDGAEFVIFNQNANVCCDTSGAVITSLVENP